VASTYGRGIWNYVLLPNYTNVISNSPQTAYPNQTATFNGTLTAQAGYASAVNLSCSVAQPAICSVQPTPITPTDSYTLTASGPVGDYSLDVHAVGTDANAITHDASGTLHVATAPAPFFNIAVTASPNTTVVNQDVMWNGTLTSVNGYSGSVMLTCTAGAPTCTIVPASLVPTAGGAAFAVKLGSAAAGTFSFSIQGTDGTLTQTTPAETLIVTTVGTDFTFSDTGNAAVTVLAGQSASYTFSAAPVGSATFSSTLTFQCASLPALTSCGFTPSSVLAGAGTTPVTFTVSTKGPNGGTESAAHLGTALRGALTGDGARPHTEHARPRLLPILTLGWVIAGIVALGQRRRLSPWRFRGIAIFCLALGLIALISCGGVSGSGNKDPIVTVTVDPVSATLWPPGLTQQQFTATVNGSSNQQVTWQVSGGNTNGTIDGTGLYTAPAVVPTQPTVTITASAAAGAATGSSSVTLQTPTGTGTWQIVATATAADGTAHSDLVTLVVK
jgi:hypothetical protein